MNSTAASTSSKPPRSTDAAAELRALKLEKLRRLELRAESLTDFVPRTTPTAVRPTHLARFVELFHRIDRGERVRACVSVPPQHWKTTTGLHGFAWLLRRHPAWTLAYSTYQLAQSYSKSRECRDMARAAGVPLHEEMQNLGEWRTTAGGGGLFTSIDGPLTGKAARFVMIDDPYKDDIAARSEAVRDRVRDWVKAVALTRLPEDGSLIIVHTRWLDVDLIGEVLDLDAPLLGERYEDINLPMLADNNSDPVRAPYTSGTRVLLPRTQTPRGDFVGWSVDGAIRQLVSLGDKADALAQGIPRRRVDGALWQADDIVHLDRAPPLSRVAVFVDPNQSSEANAQRADNAGVVTIARGQDGNAYVLGDASRRMGVQTWAAVAVAEYDAHRAAEIVLEGDGGGELNAQAIRAHLLAEAGEASKAEGRYVEPRFVPVRVVKVGARGDKRGRCETARNLYGDTKAGRSSRVYHVGRHAGLERTMTTHDFATSSKSPGDLDALSLGLHEILLSVAPPSPPRYAATASATRGALRSTW